jgi:hypothetical protein
MNMPNHHQHDQPRSGTVHLNRLVVYVSEDDPDGDSLCASSHKGRAYGALAKEVSMTIGDCQGFYLWGRFENNSLWKNIYLGKAGFGKTTHLRARILEELKDERQFLWRSIFKEEDLLKRGAELYPEMWSKYKNHWNRAISKAGASHIVWVASPNLEDSQVFDVEKDLIETLNPTANLMRSKPPSTLQPVTSEIISRFRHEIHTNRGPRK